MEVDPPLGVRARESLGCGLGGVLIYTQKLYTLYIKSNDRVGITSTATGVSRLPSLHRGLPRSDDFCLMYYITVYPTLSKIASKYFILFILLLLV
jgi:hypothetical protein